MCEEPLSSQAKSQPILGTVYIPSKTGHSLMDAGQKALTDPSPYMPEQETVKKAIVELEQLGFTIEGQGVTLSISGPIELFEKVCHTQIAVEKVSDELAHEVGSQIQYLYRSSEPVMHIPELNDLIEGIVLTAPGVPFY